MWYRLASYDYIWGISRNMWPIWLGRNRCAFKFCRHTHFDGWNWLSTWIRLCATHLSNGIFNLLHFCWRHTAPQQPNLPLALCLAANARLRLVGCPAKTTPGASAIAARTGPDRTVDLLSLQRIRWSMFRLRLICRRPSWIPAMRVTEITGKAENFKLIFSCAQVFLINSEKVLCVCVCEWINRICRDLLIRWMGPLHWYIFQCSFILFLCLCVN